MSFRKEIEQSLEQIRNIEENFRKIRDLEVLPLSFFSSTYDMFKSLMFTIHEIESRQLKMMENHLNIHKVVIENEFFTSPDSEIIFMPPKETANELISSSEHFDGNILDDIVSIDESISEPELISENNRKNDSQDDQSEDKPLSTTVINDKINKSLLTDLRKTVSLNDRFRFQRELFKGNANEMNNILDSLNKFSSLSEALSFLDQKYSWDQENETVMAFKILVGKRFT